MYRHNIYNFKKKLININKPCFSAILKKWHNAKTVYLRHFGILKYPINFPKFCLFILFFVFIWMHINKLFLKTQLVFDKRTTDTYLLNILLLPKNFFSFIAINLFSRPLKFSMFIKTKLPNTFWILNYTKYLE